MLAIDSSRQKYLGFRRNNRSVTDLTLQASVQPSRLLLIDDDRSLAAPIADYCGPGGFEVTAAFSGEDGIRLAREQYFLLIILDVMLPRIDGFEVLKRIRRPSDTPILMLTTRSRKRSHSRTGKWRRRLSSKAVSAGGTAGPDTFSFEKDPPKGGPRHIHSRRYHGERVGTIRDA